jgi:hypothetical protein
MTYNTTIIYLTGQPGVGKYTLAKELAAQYGFIVCDNQLINNPIFELLQYDGYSKIPDFAWDTIAKIRTEVFDFLAHHTKNSYVLTNCLASPQSDLAHYILKDPCIFDFLSIGEEAYERENNYFMRRSCAQTHSGAISRIQRFAYR